MSKVGRKMGHLNLNGKDKDELLMLANKVLKQVEL